MKKSRYCNNYLKIKFKKWFYILYQILNWSVIVFRFSFSFLDSKKLVLLRFSLKLIAIWAFFKKYIKTWVWNILMYLHFNFFGTSVSWHGFLSRHVSKFRFSFKLFLMLAEHVLWHYWLCVYSYFQLRCFNIVSTGNVPLIPLLVKNSVLFFSYFLIIAHHFFVNNIFFVISPCSNTVVKYGNIVGCECKH